MTNQGLEIAGGREIFNDGKVRCSYGDDGSYIIAARHLTTGAVRSVVVKPDDGDVLTGVSALHIACTDDLESNLLCALVAFDEAPPPALVA